MAEGIADFEIAVAQTQELIAKRKPLFEAAFLYKNAYARADILDPVGTDEWEIIEVKSSTTVKDANLHDLSLQWYAYRGADLDIRRCYVLHINNQYVRQGAIVPQELFQRTDVTEQVMELLPGVEERLDSMVKTITAPTCPDTPIGMQCIDPYECSLKEKCFAFLPEHHPLTLNYIKKEKAFSLIHEGVTDILKIGNRLELSGRQEIQVESLRSKKAHFDKDKIRSFLDTLEYPLYYLDFETISPAIPLYDGTGPYQQIPFQFSLHIQKAAGGNTEHDSYLADGTSDPQPELLRLLKKKI